MDRNFNAAHDDEEAVLEIEPLVGKLLVSDMDGKLMSRDAITYGLIVTPHSILSSGCGL